MQNLSQEVLDAIDDVIDFVKNGSQFYDVQDIVDLVAGEVEENGIETNVDKAGIREYLEYLFYTKKGE